MMTQSRKLKISSCSEYKGRPKMVQAWSLNGIDRVVHVVTPKTSAVDHDDSILKIIEL